ncbi:DNA/RNA non-specific endonuclease [Xanthomonas sp. CFBP 8703]|jgi:endonuclease G|uniref:Endonuclease n=1 Tax=Xanthomonas bonasiae TaxID=2810351 RepID=A0ABS3B170_9XANT|nr:MULTISPECIES: DNA/RNA non-specific endonuclease [Xanthomonas]MBD7923216.1 DNA/RNA non-specific endonuclease [Xanthomonas surreyensis]MBN6102060.1 DNA/RNA non-specific endonuclease [Xanthomonas bonasiae]MBN6110732.1 DNA/RNA non-specific endonuclease [Xanthomonas bonasiae]
MSFSLRGCLVLLALFTAQTAMAATSCATLYAGGKPPSVDASLTARTTEVCHTEYAILASGVTKGPLYSAEHLTDQQVAGAEAIGRVGSFHEETAIPAADRSKSSDYTNTGFDRGHMTPAGDASTESSEKETFSMANVVPQDHKLNTGEWARIEEQVRQLAKQRGEIYVVTGPAFDDNVTTIGTDKVEVADYVWKAVYEPGVGAAAYLCVNDDSITCDVVSIDDVITMASVDPFPSISAAMKSTPIALTMP